MDGMRQTLILTLSLLAAVVLLGVYTSRVQRDVSERFLRMADDIEASLQRGEYDDAARLLAAFRAAWQTEESKLRCLVSHEDTDEVDACLNRMDAGIRARAPALALEATLSLKASLDDIAQRDALTLENLV